MSSVDSLDSIFAYYLDFMFCTWDSESKGLKRSLRTGPCGTVSELAMGEMQIKGELALGWSRWKQIEHKGWEDPVGVREAP